MAHLHTRISYSFVIAVTLFVVCLIYIPQWKHYAPSIYDPEPVPPYLTPWTVVFVTLLSLALALISAPVNRHHPGLVVSSKALCALVLCGTIVFLLEYATGIRFRDLDLFFLTDATGGRVSLYAARPTPHSAATSLFFSSALLLFRHEPIWRKRLYQILLVAALALPTIAGVRYIGDLLVPRHALTSLRVGLSLPAITLYFLLGSGTLRLAFGAGFQRAASPQLGRTPARPV
jgi:hypothetical protein